MSNNTSWKIANFISRGLGKSYAIGVKHGKAYSPRYVVGPLPITGLPVIVVQADRVIAGVVVRIERQAHVHACVALVGQ